MKATEFEQSTQDKAHEELSKKFQHRYNEIINTPLTVEGIDNYANDALDEMITLVRDAIAQSRLYGPWQNDQIKEDRVFADFGLPKIGETLNDIYSMAQDIHSLDDIIEKSQQAPILSVIVPPDTFRIKTGSNNGFNKSDKIIPRSKTILFILEHDFNVDVHDSNQLKMTSGLLSKEMMRGISYNMIEIPELERLVLACDEENNRTFVFDTKALVEAGITPENIIKFNSKAQLRDLITQHPKSGQGIVYSGDFIDDVREALRRPPQLPQSPQPPQPAQTQPATNQKPASQNNNYLNTAGKAPAGWETINGIAKGSRVDNKTITKVIRELGLSGEIFKNKTGRTFEHYSPEDIKKIREHPRFDTKSAPEGWLTAGEIAKELGTSGITATKVVQELGLSNKTFRSERGRPYEYYSPDQITLITDYYEKYQKGKRGRKPTNKAIAGTALNDLQAKD
jgi:hypothetical protein